MSNVRSMLIEEFNKEFEELNNFFVQEIIHNLDYDIYFGYFDDYSVEKINSLFGRREVIFKNQEELFNALKLVFENGYCTASINKRRPLYYIPIFSYLLKNSPIRNSEFQEFCMRVHLTKDKKGLFSRDGLKKLDVPFRARMADTLEMVLLAPNFSTDIRTVMNLLDYIDYERFINGKRDSDYFKYLERAEKELFAYFSFLASDQLLLEYYKNREGNSRDYQYTNIRFNKDALKLMSYFINTDVRKCKNKFLEFRTLEDRLKNGSDEQSRKDNMLVAFTYRVYPSNDFYDCFSDLDLSMEDLVSFINRYEETGNILTTRQLDNLLISYRNRYLDVNDLSDDYDLLYESVREEFVEYRKQNFAFLPSEFIRLYNEKYCFNFASFNYGISTKLTRDIYEMIINGNNIIRFSDLYHTNSGREYFSSKNIKRPTITSDNEEYQRQLDIYQKYHGILEEALFDTEFTIDYVIRKKVSKDEIASFMELKNWFDTYSDEKWDYSSLVRERTFRQLQIDFDTELRNSLFRNRLNILYKYNEYALNDKVGELMTPRFFYKQLHQFEREFIESNGLNYFEVMLNAYDSGKELLPVLDSLGLAVEDINLVFGSMGGDFSIKSAAFQRKATSEAKTLEEERHNKRKMESDSEKRKLLNELFSDSEAYSLGEFCENRGISINKVRSATSLLAEDEDLREEYNLKISELRAGRNGSGGASIKEIYDSFINGIVREDGTVREFNYLDYKLMTDMPIKKFFRIATGEFGEDLVLKDFVRRHQDLIKYNEECLLDEKYVILVNGVPHEVTQDEKLAAFSFIKEHNLPKEAKLYGLVIRCALNGDLGVARSTDKPKIYVKKDK